MQRRLNALNLTECDTIRIRTLISESITPQNGKVPELEAKNLEEEIQKHRIFIERIQTAYEVYSYRDYSKLS